MPVLQFRAARLTRHHCFTNLPTDFQYLSQGMETDPETGDTYYQAFVYSGRTKRSMLAWRTAFPDCQDIEPLPGVFQEHAGYVATQAAYTALGTAPLRGGQTRQSGKRGRGELEQELPELLGAEDAAVLQAALRALNHKNISLKKGKKPVACEAIQKAVMAERRDARKRCLQYCQTEAEVHDALRFYLEELQAAEDYVKAAPPECVGAQQHVSERYDARLPRLSSSLGLGDLAWASGVRDALGRAACVTRLGDFGRAWASGVRDGAWASGVTRGCRGLAVVLAWAT